MFGRLSWYKSTKLNYNNSDNPQPDYWKLMPSSYYNVFDETDEMNRSAAAVANWYSAYNAFKGSEANRQINFDQLIYSNKQAAKQGQDAMYFIQAKHNDAMTLTLSSALNILTDDVSSWNLGVMFATNRARHYQTMEDMLGATIFHNINTYALGNYPENDPRIQYDLNNPNGEVKKGDKFGYDYNIDVNKAYFWTNYSTDFGQFHANVAARAGGVDMQRKGNTSASSTLT